MRSWLSVRKRGRAKPCGLFPSRPRAARPTTAGIDHDQPTLLTPQVHAAIATRVHRLSDVAKESIGLYLCRAKATAEFPDRFNDSL